MFRGVFLRVSVPAFALLGVLLLSACGGGGGGGGGGVAVPVAAAAASPAAPAAPVAPDAPGAAASSGQADQVFTLNAKSNGASYPIQVYLPASYASDTGTYPVIYATDADDAGSNPGGTRFAHLRQVLVQRGTRAILVGIGNSAQRQIDYNFPGATAYHAFLVQELIPLVESRYRADPRRRMLSGLSTGGSFVLTSFLAQAPDRLAFAYYLSSEAAIWQQANAVYNLEEQLAQSMAGKTLPVTLILAHSSTGGNSPDVIAMYARLASRNYPGLVLSDPAYPYGHAAMDAPAFDAAVALLFP